MSLSEEQFAQVLADMDFLSHDDLQHVHKEVFPHLSETERSQIIQAASPRSSSDPITMFERSGASSSDALSTYNVTEDMMETKASAGESTEPAHPSTVLETPVQRVADVLVNTAYGDTKGNTKKQRRRKRKTRKKVRKRGVKKVEKEKPRWVITQPRDDLIVGLDGLTKKESMTQWREAIAPHSYKLGKARAAIRLYKKCIGEKEAVIDALVEQLEQERESHALSQGKLLAQEEVFVQTLEGCARIFTREACIGQPIDHTPEFSPTRAVAPVDANALAVDTVVRVTEPQRDVTPDVLVRQSLAKASARAGSSVEDVAVQARVVAESFIERVQACIDAKKGEIAGLRHAVAQLETELTHVREESAKTHASLADVTEISQLLARKLEQSQGTEAQLRSRVAELEGALQASEARRLKVEQVSNGLGAEVSTYLESLLETCKRQLGYIPPVVKQVTIFEAPSFVQVPTAARSQ